VHDVSHENRRLADLIKTKQTDGKMGPSWLGHLLALLHLVVGDIPILQVRVAEITGTLVIFQPVLWLLRYLLLETVNPAFNQGSRCQCFLRPQLANEKPFTVLISPKEEEEEEVRRKVREGERRECIRRKR